MKLGNSLVVHSVAAILIALAMLVSVPANAAPIQLGSNSINMFRDTRGANDLGFNQGDRFNFGANVLGDRQVRH